MKEATILKMRGGPLMLRADYNERFLKALKALVPQGDRAYSFEDEAWLITTDHLEDLKELCRDHFEYVAEKMV